MIAKNLKNFVLVIVNFIIKAIEECLLEHHI